MAKVNISRLSEILEKHVDTVFHVGIDVHKNSYHVAFYGDKGQIEPFVCSADPHEVLKHFNRFHGRIIQIVYECGPTGFELARVLMAAGFKVLVVAPSRVARPVTAGAKTDRLDCLLARTSGRHVTGRQILQVFPSLRDELGSR